AANFTGILTQQALRLLPATRLSPKRVLSLRVIQLKPKTPLSLSLNLMEPLASAGARSMTAEPQSDPRPRPPTSRLARALTRSAPYRRVEEKRVFGVLAARPSNPGRRHLGCGVAEPSQDLSIVKKI